MAGGRGGCIGASGWSPIRREPDLTYGRFNQQSQTTKLPRALDGFFALPFTDTSTRCPLQGAWRGTMTVPSGAHAVAMSATADFYAKWTAAGTAATSAAVATDLTDGSASCLNPTRCAGCLRAIRSVSSAQAHCVVTFEFFQRIRCEII